MTCPAGVAPAPVLLLLTDSDVHMLLLLVCSAVQ
jgi:hypothetical protein